MKMCLKHTASIFLLWFIMDSASLTNGQRFLRGFTQEKANIFTKFYLYTNQNRNNGQLITALNSTLSHLNPAHPVRIIIHGWRDSFNSTSLHSIKDAYLQRDNFNVIIVDWSRVSSNPYPILAQHIPKIGYALAAFARKLSQQRFISFDRIYLIGYSLGAQIAGFAGKQLRPDRFNTIFALDAAGPRFKDRNAAERISSTDAKYVESIHTSTEGSAIVDFGYRSPIGQASFYPNYGKSQPGCFLSTCSHKRAPQYFAESINSEIGFWGRNCSSFEDIERERCQTNGPAAVMGGEPSKPNRVGVFYVPVRARSPFAYGPVV